MHFYTFKNIRGKILFQNSQFFLLTVDASDLKQDRFYLGGLPTCNNFKLESAFAPRYPSVLFVSKEQHRYLVNSDDVEAIENEVINTGDRELSELLLTIKSLKGKTDNLDIRPTFMAGYLDPTSNITWDQTDLIPEDTTFAFKPESFGRFTIDCTQSSTNKASGVFFINEFESIYVPLEDEANFNSMWEKVNERATADGRLSGQYVVVPTAEKHRTKSTIKNLKNMKTEEMLEFFGHVKKAGTKVDTLAGCLEHLTRRHVSNLEVGQIGLLQISSHGVSESPMQFPPLDWVLSRAAHFKIKTAQPVNRNTTNMFVEITEHPVNDTAAALFSMFEQNKRDIQMAYFSEAVLNKIFQNVRDSVNSGAPVNV